MRTNPLPTTGDQLQQLVDQRRALAAEFARIHAADLSAANAAQTALDALEDRLRTSNILTRWRVRRDFAAAETRFRSVTMPAHHSALARMQELQSQIAELDRQIDQLDGPRRDPPTTPPAKQKRRDRSRKPLETTK